MINKQNSQSSNNSGKDASKDSNSSAQNKPQTYKMIKLLGEGAYGKAYLVECISDKVCLFLFSLNALSRLSMSRTWTKKNGVRLLRKQEYWKS
jgi:hypothetical protein